MLDMIGDRLKELRTAAGMTQPEFAEIAGTSKQYVFQLEKGVNRDPNPKLIERWAAHFKVRMEWITTGRLPKEAPSASPSADSQLERLTGDIILSAYREAVAKFEALGLHATSFKPLSDPDHADLLALSIIGQATAHETGGTDHVQAEVGRGATRANRKGSGAAGQDRQEEAGAQAKPAASKRRKSAA